MSPWASAFTVLLAAPQDSLRERQLSISLLGAALGITRHPFPFCVLLSQGCTACVPSFVRGHVSGGRYKSSCLSGLRRRLSEPFSLRSTSLESKAGWLGRY